jgi:hypothetical protein
MVNLDTQKHDQSAGSALEQRNAGPKGEGRKARVTARAHAGSVAGSIPQRGSEYRWLVGYPGVESIQLREEQSDVDDGSDGFLFVGSELLAIGGSLCACGRYV